MQQNLKSALIVDDEETSAVILSSMLQGNGYSAQIVESKSKMDLVLNAQKFEVVFLDYRLGSDDGLEILRYLAQEHPKLRVVMITAHGSIQLAIDAMRLGASGFISKPFEEAAVREELHRAIRAHRPVGVEDRHESGIIGQSMATKRILEQIRKMKDASTTVLISGESGTGKELVARALHELSSRSKEPFEAINCAAIPETLLEAELFGYKKGAFTDARQDRKGLFETCSKGTLFLDEIGEMPIALQSKLLRVLQEKVLTPLGSSHSIKVDTRVVAATNRNLKVMAQQGQFRKDLYYRLSILQIDTPPLRERPEDIPELVEHFVNTLGPSLGKSIQPIPSDIMLRLTSYDWPGNVRELQNSLERAIVLSEDGHLAIQDIFTSSESHESEADGGGVSCMKDLATAKDEFERAYLQKLLRATQGNVAQASRIAGRLRTDMYRLFSKHDLDPREFKS